MTDGQSTENYYRSIIAISAVIDLAITVYFLSIGVNTVFQNIFYFTIVLASYRYRWRGAYFSVALSVYYLLVFAFFYPDIGNLIQAGIRAAMFIIIGFVVAYLSNELQKEKRRYETIFSASGSGMIVVIGNDRTIAESNSRFSELFGEGATGGKRIDAYFESTDINRTIESIESGKKPQTTEMVMTLQTGEKRTCIVTIGRLNPHEFVLSINDITDRKRAEVALMESEKKYHMLADAASEAIIVVQDGMFRFVNPKTVEMTGFSEHELLSMSIATSIHPDDRAIVMQRYQKRTMGDDLSSNFTFRVISRNGGIKWVEVSAVLINWKERPATLYLMTDVTERKKAEHQIEERMKELQAFYRLAELTERKGITIDGLYQEIANILPKSWKYPEVACARIVIDGREFRTENFREPARKQSAPIKAFDSIIGSVEVAYLEERAELDEGPFTKDERLLINAIAERTGRITERMAIEQSLRKVNAKLGIMNSVTRHDITNQMMVLNGFLELCERREKDPDLAMYFEKMSQAAANVQEQIAFANDYQELGVKAPVWASLGHQTANSFAMLHPSGVVLEDETNGAEVLADPLVEKVPYNLIDNSMRHGKHVTRIKISSRQAENALLIIYEDDGGGISAEDRKNLFEKGCGKNTGLGLFLMREILAITGITIVENGQAGNGVRFEMIVPSGAWRYADNMVAADPSKQ